MRRVGTIVLVALLIGASMVLSKVWAPTVSPVVHKEIELVERGYYYNERYGFSFKMPDGFQSHERKEGKETATVRIENEEHTRGFQVFVTSYEGSRISEERFAMDVPTGVREREEKILIDGVEAVAFVSRDLYLGITREVWVIHQGYLYEITAPMEMEELIMQMLPTWKFEEIER